MNNKLEPMKREIKDALKQGDLFRAQQLLHQYIFIDPDDYWGWLLLGGILKPEKGLQYLQKAQNLAPENQRVNQAIQWANEKMANQQYVEKPREKTTSPKPALSETEQSDKSRESHWYNLIKSGLLVTILPILAILFAIGLISLLRGNEPVIFGHQIIIVTSGSMEPVFYTGSIILVQKTDQDQVFSEGDIVMFHLLDNPQTNITHRIIELSQDQEGIFYRTKGDNNDYIDPASIRNNNIVGRYANVTFPGLGYFFSFIKSRNGLLLLAMTFGLFLIITQAVRIKEYLSTVE